jgi:hypothetical protein
MYVHSSPVTENTFVIAMLKTSGVSLRHVGMGTYGLNCFKPHFITLAPLLKSSSLIIRKVSTITSNQLVAVSISFQNQFKANIFSRTNSTEPNLKTIGRKHRFFLKATIQGGFDLTTHTFAGGDDGTQTLIFKFIFSVVNVG